MGGLVDAIFGGGSAPPAPDYAGAAQATAQGNLEATRAATKANRISQYTPYGSLTYKQTGSDPDAGWSQYVNLSPTGQALLDQANKTSIGLSRLQDNATGRVAAMQGTPFDFSSVKDLSDKTYGAYTARLDPQWAQREEQERSRLANQGIGVGSEAYTNTMRDFSSGRNDAYQQANIAAMNTMPMTYQLASALRDRPLNELNAIRTGSQVTNPTFSNVPSQATTAGPDMLGAATAQGNWDMGNYNAQQASQNSAMSGLFSLGSAFLGMPPGVKPSDRRLKKCIRRVGKHGRLNVYAYRYIWGGPEQIGVMAQEVERINPAAVVEFGGLKAVNYGAI